jgi:hypothetical protein
VDRRIGHAADARELVGHDLGFETYLGLVVYVLPLATAASGLAKVWARRRDTVWGRLEHVDEASKGVAAFILSDLDANRLAGQRVGDKDDAPLVSA